ncbi:MAG: DUF99 family protein [Candidatus Bathyarchaeia archaeon]
MSLSAYQKLRVVGIEDGSFVKEVNKKALLSLVLFHGLKIEDARFAWIKVDGLDATSKVVKALDGWKFDVVILAGVSFGGFNLIDPAVINDKLGKPIIVVSRTKPKNEAVKRALKRHFRDWEIRWKVFEKLGSVFKVKVDGRPPIFIETIGIDSDSASKLIRALSVYGKVPEPIRVARLIARGLS